MNHIRIPDWQSRGRGFESHLLHVRFVYGETSPEFNKLDRNNRFEGYIGYHLFQNNYANTGRGNTNANNVKYGPDGIASYGVTKSMRGHSVAGALEYSGT